MAVTSGVQAAHATLSTTVSDTVELTGGRAKSLAVTNRDASQTLWVRLNTVNEVQTLTLTAGAEGDTFDLTQSGSESSLAVTIPAGGFASVTAASVQATLETMNSHTSATVTATLASAGVFTITFIGTAGNKDQGAITVTSKTGAADGSVAETRKGLGAVASADENYAVLPLQTKVFSPFGGDEISLVGSANAYSVEAY